MEGKKQTKIQLSFGESVPGIDTINKNLILFSEINQIKLSDYPVRVDIAMLAICTKGSVHTAINLKEFEMRPNSILVAMPDQIMQQLERSADFDGYFIGVSRELINEVITGMNDMLSTFLYIQENPVTGLDEQEMKTMVSYFEFMSDMFKDKNHRYFKQLSQTLLTSLFYTTFDIYFSHGNGSELNKNRQEELFEKFMQQLHQNFIKERSVAFYAERLDITPKYLSQTIKSVTGKTAGEWIDLYVMLEAKVLLRSSNDSILTISEKLNFPNQSFFGKYFKQHADCSPKNYRKKQ